MKCQCTENICLCWEHNQRSNSCWGDTKNKYGYMAPNISISISINSEILQWSSLLLYVEGRSCIVFFIPISGKICCSQTLHVLTLLKLTSIKEVIKYELVYLRDHIDNKCSIRTRHRSYTALPSLLCIKLKWVCALQFWLLFQAGNWTILESETERIFICIQVIWLWTRGRNYAWAEHTFCQYADTIYRH